MKQAGYDTNEDILAMESIEEKIITLQMCNNECIDSTLNDYILFAGGDAILQKLNEQAHWAGEFNSVVHTHTQFETLKQKYAFEMAFFLDKFKSHPAMQAQKAAAMGVQDSE